MTAKSTKGIIAAMLASFICISSSASSTLKITSNEGLSSNAVFNIYQDSLGVLYIGTLGGLNIWNGHKMENLNSNNGRMHFEGNKIRHIIPHKRQIFILTRYGLARMQLDTKEVAFMEEFAYDRMIGIDKRGNIFSCDGNNHLKHFNCHSGKTTVLKGFSLEESDDCNRISITDDNTIFLFSRHSAYRIKLLYDGETPHIEKVQELDKKFVYVSQPHCDTPVYAITDKCEIFLFDPDSGNFSTIAAFTPPQTHNINNINGVVATEDGYFINFWNGLFFLPKGSRQLESTEIQSNSFTIIKDRFQHIIWIGTDSNGLIRWDYKETKMKCITFDDIPYEIDMPIRCLHMEEQTHDLWFGTKGDGLIRMKDFRTDKNFNKTNTIQYSTCNSCLADNRVYCLVPSIHNGFYIGTEGHSLNWHKNGTNSLTKIPGSEKIRHVHSIAEQNDSVLWVANGTNETYKCRIISRQGIPAITDIDTINTLIPLATLTQIMEVKVQNDSTIWFGSKGQGCLQYNPLDESFRVLHFPKENGFAVNEISQFLRTRDMVVATKMGLLAYSHQNDSLIFPQLYDYLAVTSLQEDSSRNIWAGTNSGIIVLDSCYTYRKKFGKFSGMEVLEYSDRACCRDTSSGMIFFGGTNGFTVIKESQNLHMCEYLPKIHMTDIIINNVETPLERKLKKGHLVLPQSSSAFTIKFLAIDHLNHQDYEFSYNLKGDDIWHKCEGNAVSISGLASGKYLLKVRYINKAMPNDSMECTLPIRITPPAYRSWPAYVFYILVIILAIYGILMRHRRKYKDLQRNLQEQYAEQIRKIKAETSATMTNELSVMITFILGLCQQIRLQAQKNVLLSEKVRLIEYNMDKITRTLTILNEFKEISEENGIDFGMSLLPVSQISREILDMEVAAKSSAIRLTYDIQENIIIASDKERFLSLFKTLTDMMLSSSHNEGHAHFSLLQTSHNNTVMEFTFPSERNSYESLISDKKVFHMCSGLAESINASMCNHYDEESNIARITIYLQHIPYTGEQKTEESTTTQGHRDSLYLVSTHKEIISLFYYFMRDSYCITTFENLTDIFERMSSDLPDLIIYDTTSMTHDSESLIRTITEEKETCHIPIIMLTSSLSSTKKDDYLKYGCDLCIELPFNIESLLTTLDKLLEKKSLIEQYYNSPESSLHMQEGKLMHNEDKEFMKRLSKVIDENISNPVLTAPIIADGMKIGVRTLYRRLEGITDKKLRSVIIETRIHHAARLLTSTRLSIEEIMYKTGHENASTFYRNFKNFYGVPPKEYRQNISASKKN